jgi:hypothetical protein
MGIIQCYTYFGQRRRGWFTPTGDTVAPCLNWLVNRFEPRAGVIIGDKTPVVQLGKITHAQFGRLYMLLVPQDWDPLQTTLTLQPGRDIYTLWLNIPPKYTIPAVLRPVGVSSPGLYRFVFDTAQIDGVDVWGVFVPHWEDDKGLKFGATWGGLIQQYNPPKNAGGGNV